MKKTLQKLAFLSYNFRKYSLFWPVTVYLKCSDEDSASVLRDFTGLISNLSIASSVNIMTSEAPPEGCAMTTASSKCEVHIMLKVEDIVVFPI